MMTTGGFARSSSHSYPAEHFFEPAAEHARQATPETSRGVLLQMSGAQSAEQAEHASERAAVNLSFSPLLQSCAQPQHHVQHHEEQQVHDARRKFASSLESNVLDFLHYHVAQLEECVRTLHTLFSNVVQHPEEPKYRRIKAANKAYLKHVASVKHAEELMLQAGWRSKVVDLEKSWVFDHSSGSTEFRVLQEATDVLHKALATLQAKAERKRREEEERKGKVSSERERVRLALEDDRRQRQLAQQLTAAAGPARAQPLPSERRMSAGGGPGAMGDDNDGGDEPSE